MAATWLTLPVWGSVGLGAVFFYPLVGVLGAGSVSALPRFVEVFLMVAPDKSIQRPAIAQMSEKTDTDDDAIQKELTRRNEFDRSFRESLFQLTARIHATSQRDSDADRRKRNDTELHRLTAKVTREAMFRHAFDERHPRIYPTPEARRKAYESLHPSTWPPTLPSDDVEE